MSERVFKKPEGATEFKEITFIRPAELREKLEKGEIEAGPIVEGTFLGSLENPHNENVTDYKFELENGSEVLINGAGNLKYKMSLVDVGDFIQVSYLGMQEIKKGKMAGKLSHNFEVLVAE